MALNPTFASASVNPSQSMGSDASAPAQGALPTGMPQNTGFSGLGQQPPRQPVEQQPFAMPLMPQEEFGVPSPFMNQGSSTPMIDSNGYNQFGNFMGQQPQQDYSSFPPGYGLGYELGNNYSVPKEPLVPMIPNFNQSYYQSPQYQSYLNNMPQYASDDYRMMPFGGYGSSTIANLQNQSYEDFLKNPSMAQQPQAPYNNGQLRYDSGDTDMPQVGNLGNDVEIPKLNYLGYKPGWQQEADNTWSYNTENMSPYNQYDQDWKVNYIGYRGVPNDAYQKYQDALSRGEAGDFSGDVMNQYTATTKPRYTSDFSQLGLSQTALDSLKNRPQDLGSYYYDTQTGMFNQGAGRPGPNIPGQRIYTGMTGIPLDVMNKLGSGEEIDFSPYKQYTNGFNTEGQPNPPQIGDQPLPVQQPLVGGLQDPQTNPFQSPLNDFKNTEQWQRVAPNYAGLPQNVQDYVASQLSQGAMDGGTNWQYNPTTQTFSGTPNGLTPFGNKPTPEVKSLAQMKDYVNWINSPNASTTRPPPSWDQPAPTQRNPLTPTATPTGTTPMATNPLSTYATTPTTGFTPAPTLNATPGSASSGSFGQGGVLPNVTTTQQQVTAAPSFYTDYLNQLATRGGQAAQDAQYVGAQPLQEQAFNLASQNVGNYQPTLQNAINLASSVGNTNLAQAIGDVGQANIARNLSPQATAGIVGSGQFGSKRGAQALGDVIANAQLGLTAQQQQAMQQDMANRIAAAQQLGTLANSTQQLGLGDVNALSTLGQQQQTIAQNQQLFPMQQLANQSALLRGYTIPTSVSASQTGPGQQGQFQTSPLQQIMSVGTLLGALAKPTADYIDPKTGLLVKGRSSGENILSGLGAGGTSLLKYLDSISGKTVPSTNETNLPSITTPGGQVLTPRGDGTYLNEKNEIVNSDGVVQFEPVTPDPGIDTSNYPMSDEDADAFYNSSSYD